MLGHQVYLKFLQSGVFTDVRGTIREQKDILQQYRFFAEKKIYDKVDLSSDGFVLLRNIVDDYQPHIVINCVVRKNDGARQEEYLLTNSFLPHYLAKLLKTKGGKLVHISTDGVFSGNKGNYSENDIPDSVDLYAKSKFYGEVDYDHHLTIRTSLFGHELLGRKTGLVEWFLNSQVQSVQGYTNVHFSGISTNLLAKIILHLIHLKATGILHIGSYQKISKHDLLSLINNEYGTQKTIIPIELPHSINRSLQVTKMRRLRVSVPGYPDMIQTMREEHLSLEA